MPLRSITADQVLFRLHEFDAVIDARSPSEFAEDRLPGALNWPSLDDAERARVGTIYKQISAFEARKVGAALVARNVAGHLERHVARLPPTWKPLVYCWRGGQRSGSLGAVLGQIGFTAHVLDGGYREFRRAVLRELDTLPGTLRLHVLCGRTGSAKSRLLQALAAAGAQVLDLEALAAHRGSVLGPLPDRPQPSQKAFETALWQALRGFDQARPVFAESESRTIGRLRVPDALLQRLRAAPCTQLAMPLPARVAFLMDDYAHLAGDVEAFCARIAGLRELRGAAVVERWQAMARSHDGHALVAELLEEHYDPTYTKSMARNFAGFATAPLLELPDAQPETLATAAVRLRASVEGGAP
jgi:tRNA 2-selenouridine synthase